MRQFITLLICAFFITPVISQETDTFKRKGRILVETGYGLIGGYSSGTGVDIRVGDETLTALGFNMGAFLTENLALKANLGILTGDGPSITNLTAGVKYYAAGKIPLELKGGFIDFESGMKPLVAASVGYAAKLAPNIYLEPVVGFSVDDIPPSQGSGAFLFNVNFALML